MPKTALGRYYGMRGYTAGFDTPFNRRVASALGKAARKYVDSKLKQATTAEKPKRGRPKGSRNKGSVNPNTTYRRGGNSFVGKSYGGNMMLTQKGEISINKKPLKGKFNSLRGTLVVNKKIGKQLTKQKRNFPHSVYQKYYLSKVNMDVNGNIGSLDRRYTNMSVDTKTGTGFLFNVGACCLSWDPAEPTGKIGNVEIPAQGDANVTNPNPLWRINGSNTGLEQDPIMMTQSALPETATPYQQGVLPPVLKYTIPNHVFAALDLNLSFMSASISDMVLSISVIRNISSEPTQPGNWSNVGTNGGIPGADTIKLICNDHHTTGRQYETIFKTTKYLKGINLNDKDPKVYYCKKRIKMNYSRSTCRRVTSALDNTLLAGAWAPTYEIDQTGSMYSNLIVKIMARCIDNGKIVTNYKGVWGSTGQAIDYYPVPKLIDMDSGPDEWNNCNIKKSRFRVGGSIGLKCMVRDKNRGIGGDVATNLGDLQNQVNELSALVGTLQGEVEDAHAEIDEHLADEDPHTEAGDHNHVPNLDDDHTHPGWTDDIGEHQHATPGDPTTDTVVHSHSEVNIP